MYEGQFISEDKMKDYCTFRIRGLFGARSLKGARGASAVYRDQYFCLEVRPCSPWTVLACTILHNTLTDPASLRFLTNDDDHQDLTEFYSNLCSFSTIPVAAMSAWMPIPGKHQNKPPMLYPVAIYSVKCASH